MKKRIISLLLALIMALSLLPVSVLAADDHTGQVHAGKRKERQIAQNFSGKRDGKGLPSSPAPAA